MFEVGQRVKIITEHWGLDQLGLEGTLIEYDPTREFCFNVDFGPDNGIHEFNSYRDGDLKLIEPEPIPEAPMVPFIFVMTAPSVLNPERVVINKSYGVELFNSLEAAQAHCVVLRERHETDNIHAYVRLGNA